MNNFKDLHQIANDKNQSTYVDPKTGYVVLTSQALLKQGKCCGNACRHCPFGHINVKENS